MGVNLSRLYEEVEKEKQLDIYRPAVGAITGTMLTFMAGNDFDVSVKMGIFSGSTIFLSRFIASPIESRTAFTPLQDTPPYIIESVINALLGAGLSVLDSDGVLIPRLSMFDNGFGNKVLNTAIINGLSGLAANYAIDVMWYPGEESTTEPINN
jgi:hypothetical protein